MPSRKTQSTTTSSNIDCSLLVMGIVVLRLTMLWLTLLDYSYCEFISRAPTGATAIHLSSSATRTTLCQIDEK
jgi:hypothetical protein